MGRRSIWVGCLALSALSCSRDDTPSPGAAPSASGSAPAREAPRSAGSAPEPSSSKAAIEAPDRKPSEPPGKPPSDPSPSEVPDGYSVMTVGGVTPTPHGNAVVLTNEGLAIGVPIFIGGTEALSIALRLRDERYARPLTHDLVDSLVGELGGKIVSVRVDKLVDNVFHGTVLLRHAGRVIELDARPSDALALAVGNASPIYVARQVIDEAGISLDMLEMAPPSTLDAPLEPRGVEL